MSYVVHKRRLTIIILFFSHDNSTYCCTFYACVFLKPFLNYGEIGIYHFSGINYIHTAVQPLPPPTSRTSSSKTKYLYPLNTKSPFPPPPKPWPPPFYFVSEFDHSRNVAWMESYNLCPFVTGLISLNLVAQWQRKCLPMQETWVWSLGWADPLEKEMATHSSILAWEIPRTEESGGLQYMGSQRVRPTEHTHTQCSLCVRIHKAE